MTESQSLKIKEAQELIPKRIEKLSEEVEAFFDNLFTDDIKEMVCEYTKEDYKSLSRNLGCKYEVNFYNNWIKYDTYNTLKRDVQEYNWHWDTIDDISRSANLIKSIEKQLTFFSERTEEIIATITDGYKRKVESDNKKLNEALEILGSYTEPIKKCKITVEWIN